jgi:microcystin degradation protein MlrC
LRLRVGVLGLLQESNTFINRPTTLADFENDQLAEGSDVRARLAGSHHEIGGFFHGLESDGLEAVGIFAARAIPFGVMTADTLAILLARIDTALDRCGPLDGLLVAPHGATVAAGCPDVDGHWVSRLRRRFGPDVPIIGTLDLHANVSPQLVESCNALFAYRTNPHLDQWERGVEAARLMARTLRREVRPTMAAVMLPLTVNIERQATAEEPCFSLYELADKLRAQPGVLSDSLVLGFPYADVSQMGATTLAVTDRDADEAKRLAEVLAEAWWARRSDFDGRFVGVEEALDQATRLDGPICLLDMGDNVGGGSPGDGTILAHALDRRAIGPTFVCLFDPEAVLETATAAEGDRVRLRVGAKTDRLHGFPLEAEFTLRGRFDGRFEEQEVRHGGSCSFDQGATVVLETDRRLTVMLTSRRMPPFSLQQLTSCGLGADRFWALVAKGVHAPVAAYAPVCRHMIRVDTPGVTTANLARLEYRYRRRPMYPFEPETSWHAADLAARGQ